MYAVNNSQLFCKSQSVVEEKDVLTARTNFKSSFVNNQSLKVDEAMMSRRKQNKPRHLDADDEIAETGQIKLDSNQTGEKVTMDTKLQQQPELNGEPLPTNQSPNKQQQPSIDSMDIPALYRQEAQKYFSQQGLIAPPNHFLMARAHMEPKQAVISPLPRSQDETSASQPLRAAGPRYFQSISCPDPVSSNPDQYSDDEDVPSDIESCANESEQQEDPDNKPHITVVLNNHRATTSSPVNYSSDVKQQSELKPSEGEVKEPQSLVNHSEEVDDKHADEDDVVDDDEDDEVDGSDDNKDLAGSSSNGTVKLKALETTNVAVAQVVETDSSAAEGDGNLPNLQQVLFTLHQQQMFQLQVLQQIQHQVTKLAHTDEETDSNGVVKPNPAAAAAAAMFGMSWLNRGLASSLHQQRTDEACGLAEDDDVSESSLMSNEMGDDEQGLAVNDDDPECPDDSHHHSSDLAAKRLSDMDRDLSDDMLLTPSGSPDLSPRSTPAKTPSSTGDRTGDDMDEPFHHSSPISRHMPPLPYLGGLGHFMPPGFGNPNPLLPSNMFNPHSMPMPGRFPIFRTPVLPKPEEEDPMEEFMEIDTSDTNKLEEFMKKMEPTLKDPNQCAICKKVLSCKSALQMHYRTHTGSRPFKCKICGRAFTTKGNLKTHMSVHRARHAGPPLHQCPVCNKKFNSILHAQEHMRIHLGEIHAQQSSMPKQPIMPGLPQGFMPCMPGGYPLLPPALPQERRITNNNNNCLNLSNNSHKELNSSFEQKSPLGNDNHISQVKRPPVDSVEELRQKRQKTDVVEHKPENAYLVSSPQPQKDDLVKNSSQDLNPYSASLQALEESVKEMDKKMTSSSNFFIKTEISPPYVNGGDRYNSELSPNRHSTDFNNKEGKKESVQTSVITQAPHQPSSKNGGTSPGVPPTSQPISSSNHHNTNNQSPPSCPTSPFSASRRQSLRHICSVCHKPFSSSSALQIHMRTHTGERPFKCNVCDKAFTTKGNLKVHMSTHAIVTGPPRRGRRMSMDGIPSFTSPGQFPPVAQRPPMHMFPGFPYPSMMSNIFMHPGKGLPFMPTMGLPSMPLLSPRRDDATEKRESSVSPTDMKDYHKSSSESAKENNNIPSKGLHGELDLSTRNQAIKT